mmetsp:Transcript_31267/g.89686  ORF Transcript_31267/g.89686 Transcript_31267/m.89686 type:complete len:208 (+) Transcript_31267:597-1220(+)
MSMLYTVVPARARGPARRASQGFSSAGARTTAPMIRRFEREDCMAGDAGAPPWPRTGCRVWLLPGPPVTGSRDCTDAVRPADIVDMRTSGTRAWASAACCTVERLLAEGSVAGSGGAARATTMPAGTGAAKACASEVPPECPVASNGPSASRISAQSTSEGSDGGTIASGSPSSPSTTGLSSSPCAEGCCWASSMASCCNSSTAGGC